MTDVHKILVRSCTNSAIDAWGPDGAHLGSAQQLRLIDAREAP